MMQNTIAGKNFEILKVLCFHISVVKRLGVGLLLSLIQLLKHKLL